MPFLDYFRCCCCKKPQPEPTREPLGDEIKVRHPTMVSYDFESTKGVKRAFDALPAEHKTIPPRNAPRAS